MPTETQTDPDNAGGNETQAETPLDKMTPEQLRAELARRDESIANLTKTSNKDVKELQKFREIEKNRLAEQERLKREGLSEPEKLVAARRDAEDKAARLERELEQEKRDRIDDSNERSVLHLASKFLNEDHVDIAFTAIDKSLLKFDETGKITGGIDKALEKLANDRPTWGKKKPANNGTGAGHFKPVQMTGDNNGSANPIADAFSRKTSLGT